ncbi:MULTISPECIES: hypothetical protein [Phyllobacteriaceae]|uniref:hypothetical protein n=1 Tax=Phyllobacteriaceae TaxID=69277 RepID=UPI0011123173|nr:MULTISPECIES: hypothetical protein [Mesorhizobium]MBN9235052.1 hypothetical protein [Mesorhizobium sp.]MDQ0330834.1 hypothetical protein [Mesorhizobium sp. YL-MeA3-2017]
MKHKTVQGARVPVRVATRPAGYGRRWPAAAFIPVLLAGGVVAACTSTPSTFEGPQYSDETRQMEKELAAEATALGVAQGAVGIAASFDRTGIGSLVAGQVGMAARNAMMVRAEKRMQAQVEKDNQEFYRRHGIAEVAENEELPPKGRKPKDRKAP